jgi:hypothetical protein
LNIDTHNIEECVLLVFTNFNLAFSHLKWQEDSILFLWRNKVFWQVHVVGKKCIQQFG